MSGSKLHGEAQKDAWWRKLGFSCWHGVGGHGGEHSEIWVQEALGGMAGGGGGCLAMEGFRGQ